MGSLTLNINYGKNQGLILSPSEIKDLYFFGISLKSKDGQTISDEDIATYIGASQQEVERYFNIKLEKQVIEETRDFYRDDFRNWSFVRFSFPIVEAEKLTGTLNGVMQIDYPKDWLSVKKTNDSLKGRNMYIVPNVGTAQTGAIYSGLMPNIGFLNQSFVPNYWIGRYITGFEVIPDDLINFIGKLTAINIFRIMGDLIFGPGITSQTVGIDGVSQAISGTMYKGRIEGYLSDLKELTKRLGYTYTSLEMLSM